VTGLSIWPPGAGYGQDTGAASSFGNGSGRPARLLCECDAEPVHGAAMLRLTGPGHARWQRLLTAEDPLPANLCTALAVIT
jgi:hypothetical protein